MSASQNLGAQFDFHAIPEPFGTTPIPEGHVRFNHYTRSADNIPGIRQHGLLQSKAQESFDRGTSEYPTTFATAGTPSENALRNRTIIEGHIDQHDLDIGNRSNPADLEARNSTITTWKDIPPKNIVAIHEPWHQTFRYVQGDPSMEAGVMHGDYDSTGDADADKGIAASKIPLAAKVMLGGKLGGTHW